MAAASLETLSDPNEIFRNEPDDSPEFAKVSRMKYSILPLILATKH